MQMMEAQKHNAPGMIEADCGLISSSDTAVLSGSLKAQHRPPRSLYTHHLYPRREATKVLEERHVTHHCFNRLGV